MTGDHITEPLDYLYEELSPEGMAEARRHLASCPDCRREMRAIRETVKLYREVPRPTAPDGLAERTAAAALAGLARPAAAPAASATSVATVASNAPAASAGQPVTAGQPAQAAMAAPAGPVAPSADTAPVLYPPPPRTPLPYPDMEKEFARLKEEVMRDAPKGLRSWLFHPAWTVAASVIFLCALLMHLSPRMQTSRTMVIPAAPTRSDEAARQIRLRERIPPSEPRSASSPPAGEPPPILSEAEALNRFDLDHLLVEEDEPPRGKFTVTRVNPTALLDEAPADASSPNKLAVTATPGGWVASGTGTASREPAPAAAPPPPASSPEGARYSASAGSAGTVGAKPTALAETAPLPAPRESETPAAPSMPRASIEADAYAPVESGNGYAFGAPQSSSAPASSPSPAASGLASAKPAQSAGSMTAPAPVAASSQSRRLQSEALQSGEPQSAPSSAALPRAAPPSGASRPESRSSDEPLLGQSTNDAETGPLVSTPLAADDNVAFDGLIVDWEDVENPPQIVPRPTPLNVPERIRVLTALVGMQIAHHEWADAWRTVALVEAYDKHAAENLRSLVRTAQDAATDAARDAATSAAADTQSPADLPAADGDAATSPAVTVPDSDARAASTQISPDSADSREGRASEGHPLRPDATPSEPVNGQRGSSGRDNGTVGTATEMPSSSLSTSTSALAGPETVSAPATATGAGAGTVRSGTSFGDPVWQEIPGSAGTIINGAASAANAVVQPPTAASASASTWPTAQDGAIARSGSTVQTSQAVPAEPVPVPGGVRVTPVFSSGPAGSYVAEPIIMPPIVMDPSGRMPQVVLLTQEQAAELHAAGRLQYAVPPTVIPMPEAAVASIPATASSSNAAPSGEAATGSLLTEQAANAGASSRTLPPAAPTVIPAPEPRQTSQPRERPKGFSTDPYVRGY